MNTREFCELVREARQKRYKTAREFFRLNSLSCTYAYYSKVEKDTVPEIKIALEIIDKLKINTRTALYAWTRDQMPTNELRALFSQIGDSPSLSSDQNNSDRSTVINRMQVRLLLKNPVYWELLIYFGCFFGKKAPSPKDLSSAFGIKAPEVVKMLNELYDYGLLDKNSQGSFVSKEWVFIPYEDEFKPLRDFNFRRAFDQFLTSDPGTQFRTTITCPLLPRHQKTIEAKFLALTNELIDLSDKEKTADAIPYTIGIFSSPRRFGNE